MKVSDYLKEDFCLLDLTAATKEDAIREIASSLMKTGKVADLDTFVKDILERESLGSTGIGHGVAIPHARTDSISGFIVGFGRSSKGVDFNAIDSQDVHLVFLMGTAPKELNFYLRLLAELSKLLMDPSFRKALMSAESQKEAIKVIKDFEAKQ